MAQNYTCNDEMAVLLSIDKSLKIIHTHLMGGHPIPGYRGNVNGWTYLHVGKSWFYEKVVTYNGSANTQDIDFPVSVQVNRIEQIWNDATTKDFSIRVFTDPGLAYYVELDTQTGNTATSRLLQLGIEYKYLAGARLRIYSGTNTNEKIVTIRVQVDEL